MAVGMSFKLETPHLYGLPERKQKFKLDSTLLYKTAEDQPKPYRFFNKDQFLSQDSRDSLYGSIPYLTGHAADHDSSVLWVNSAETWVDVYASEVDVGRVNQEAVDPYDLKNVTYVNFISESGAVDFFVFGSSAEKLKPKTTPPKVILTKLSEISGFAPLPPINSLGFHFSKWDEVKARTVTGWNQEFTLR